LTIVKACQWFPERFLTEKWMQLWSRAVHSLPVGELAELLADLPRSRQQPLGLGVLLIALNERLPDAYKLLPPAGHPGPGEGRRRSLQELVADRRAARVSRHPDGPAAGLARSLADRQRRADLHAERARAGAVAERRWRRGYAPRRPTPARPTAARSAATRRPTGRSRGATASPRTTSAIAGRATGSAPSTSGRHTAGRCRSRRRAPRTGCRSAAMTTRERDQPPEDRSRRWQGGERDREDR
jgi:hypothetical protein